MENRCACVAQGDASGERGGDPSPYPPAPPRRAMSTTHLSSMKNLDVSARRPNEQEDVLITAAVDEVPSPTRSGPRA